MIALLHRFITLVAGLCLLCGVHNVTAAMVEEDVPMPATSFYRAVNMNGAALTIDGNSWTASSGAANFSFTGGTFENQSVTLSPSTDTNRATMIRSSVWGSNVTANMSAVPNGYYKIYVYVWEDNWAETFSISLEGTTAVSNYNSGTAGTWAKLGPFIRNITDGIINLSTSGGDANISGIEVWSVSAPPVVANPIPDHTAIVGDAFTYTVAANAFTDPDAGTTLSLSATLSNGNPLPSWLAFNSTTRKFSGTPTSGDITSINIRVTATDGDTDVSDEFTLTVANGFYRAINLNGSALSIDGNSWEASSGAANFSMSGISFSNQSVTLIPTTDANRTTMIRSSIYSTPSVNITSVPNGVYDVYVYVWEDNFNENYSLSIEGSTVVSNALTGAAGEWQRLGPYRRTISDGAINVSGTGSVNLSGVELYRASTGDVVLEVTVTPATFSLAAGQARRLARIVLPDAGDNQDVTWSSSGTSVATVDATGLVRAVSPGTATITATSVHGAYSGSSTITVQTAGTNMIANPEFDQGLDHWIITDYAGTPANSATVVQGAGLSGNNALYIDIANTTPDDWRYQVKAALPFRLEVGHTYQISFMAIAQATRNLTVSLWGESALLNHFYSVVQVGTSPQTFSLTYTCNDSDVNAETNFSLAFYTAIGALNDVWIDKVSVADVTGITQVTGVSVSPPTLNINAGSTAQLSKTIAPANATNQDVTWSSNNPAVATVNGSGLVTAVSAGTATITVTTANGNHTATTAVTVNTATPPTMLESVLERYAFQYKYDGRDRMTHKKVPGAGWVYMVYDNRDRLVMTQDANQRVKSPREWTFTKYDALNRSVSTGIYSDNENNSQEDMQNSINLFYASAAADEWFEVSGSTVHGYTNNSFPDVANPDAYLTVTYYDNYTFTSNIPDSSQYVFDNNQITASGNEPGQESENFTRVKGQITGVKIRNLDTNDWYWTVNYYDNRYRVIQTVADNSKGGIDRMTSVYDFTGKVLRTKTDHSIASGPVASTERRMHYDHAGRLLQTDHKTGSDPFVTLAKNEYNALGQPVRKGLHSTDNGVSFKQQVDYRYNIRGWLTRINDSELSSIDGGPKDYFGMNLSYEKLMEDEELPESPFRYNGNIRAVTYSVNQGLGLNDAQLEISEPTERGYWFSYDAMNRLRSADANQKTEYWNYKYSYSEGPIYYDLNGNILYLDRIGENQQSDFDALEYDYDGNRLISVTDWDNAEWGFIDGNTSDTDYFYDANGNMVTDLNKGISTIQYNYLNLPARVEKNTGEYIKYIYDATGAKLSQEVYNASELQKKSDYMGEFFYENDTLRFIHHDEGRVVINEQNPEYQYYLKDHLGNNRATFTATPRTDTFVATMETDSQAEEEQHFGNYMAVTNDLLDYTDQGSQYDKVLVLNGGYNGQVGLAKSFAVVPGDVISATVYAKYTGGTGGVSNIANFAAALTGAFSMPAPPPGIDGSSAFEALNTVGMAIAGGARDDNDGAPKGFINILVFDKDFNIVDFAFQQIDASYVQGGGPKVFYPALHVESLIRQPGYAYVFLSNEGANEQQIGFDDYEVQHIHSDVIGANEYYPFGLTFNNYQRENSVTNKFKFQGQEHIDDLNLGWDSFRWRNHQPDIGRFFNIDPLADKYTHYSPYVFSGNEVTSAIELEGLEPLRLREGVQTLIIVNLGFAGNPPDGYTQAENSGVMDEQLGSISTLDNGPTQVGVYTSSRRGNTNDDIASTIVSFKESNPDGKVIAVGHSLGADNLVEMAQENSKVTIDKMILLDLFDYIPSTTISDNVKDVTNFHQDNEIPYGYEVKADNKNATMVENIPVQGSTHTSIDDNLTAGIISMINRLIESYDKSQKRGN